MSEPINGGPKLPWFTPPVQSWRDLILILTLIGGVILSYATLKAQSDQNSAEIQELKNTVVSKEVYTQEMVDIDRRLTYIQGEIERHDLNQLH